LVGGEWRQVATVYPVWPACDAGSGRAGAAAGAPEGRSLVESKAVTACLIP
jgi:hypothetical protein